MFTICSVSGRNPRLSARHIEKWSTDMAITITTAAYEAAHGRKPAGRAQWAFTRLASHGAEARTFLLPTASYREACALVRARVRAEGFQDATVELGA